MRRHAKFHPETAYSFQDRGCEFVLLQACVMFAACCAAPVSEPFPLCSSPAMMPVTCGALLWDG